MHPVCRCSSSRIARRSLPRPFRPARSPSGSCNPVVEWAASLELMQSSSELAHRIASPTVRGATESKVQHLCRPIPSTLHPSRVGRWSSFSHSCEHEVHLYSVAASNELVEPGCSSVRDKALRGYIISIVILSGIYRDRLGASWAACSSVRKKWYPTIPIKKTCFVSAPQRWREGRLLTMTLHLTEPLSLLLHRRPRSASATVQTAGLR